MPIASLPHRRPAAVRAAIFALLVASTTASHAQRPFQKFWQERYQKAEQPAIVEDELPPLSLEDERYLDPSGQDLAIGSTVFPGGKIVSRNPVAELALESYAEGAYSMETGNTTRALKAYEEALAKDPENIWFKIKVASLCLGLNDISRAETLLEEVLAVDAKNITALLRLGEAKRLAQRIPEAKAVYARAIAARPHNIEALLNLADIAFRVEHDMEGSKQYTREILRIDDKNLNALMWNADACALTGEMEEANVLYERLIRYRPSLIDRMQEIARRIASAGRTSDAIQLYERAMLIAPTRDGIRIAWESLLEKNSGGAAVTEAYERIAKDSKNDLRIYELFAEYLVRVENWQRLVELRQEMLAIDPDHLASLLDLAKDRMRNNDFASAEPFLDRALKSHAADPDTYRIVGLAFLQQNLADRAKPLLERAVALNPKDIRSLGALAAIAEHSGDTAGAEKYLRTSIDQQPVNPMASRQLGLLYLRRGERQMASEQFQMVVAADSSDLKSWMLLAQLYFEDADAKGLDFIEARAEQQLRTNAEFQIEYGILAQGFGEFERSRKAIERALATTPEDLRARTALAQTYILLGLPDQGLKVIEDSEPYIRGNDEAIAAKNLAKAGLLLELRRNEEAEKVLRDLIALDAREIAFREPLLQSLVRQGKDEEAQRELNTVIREFSAEKPIETQLLRARIFIERGDAPRGVSVLRQLQTENPENSEVIFQLAAAAGEVNDLETAEKYYRRLLDMGGSDANKYYETASNNLGYLYARSGIKLDEAERLIKQAMLVNPNAAYILDSAGVLYMRNGNLAEARRYLERAARISARDPEILTNLGQLYEKVGEPDLARASYDKAILLKPDYKLARERRDALAVPDNKAASPEQKVTTP